MIGRYFINIKTNLIFSIHETCANRGELVENIGFFMDGGKNNINEISSNHSTIFIKLLKTQPISPRSWFKRQSLTFMILKHRFNPFRAQPAGF